MKKTVIFVLLFIGFLSVNAQNTEPGCNIGKSLYIMQNSVFPGMKYVGNSEQGKEYIWTDSEQNGMSNHFVFNHNNVLTSECMIISGNDGFPNRFYNSLCDSFIGKYRWALVSSTTNHQHFIFSNFTLDIVIQRKSGNDILMVIYEKL